MTRKIGMTVATLLAAGGIGLTGLTSAASSSTLQITPVTCPSMCPDVYKPVTCKMSDGTVRTFGNRCEAGVFACRHRLTIVSCQEGDPT
jgi:hypothetical protein